MPNIKQGRARNLLMKRILVTGGTGFIGRAVLRELFAMDVQVSAVIRDRESVPEGFSKIFWTDDLFEETDEFWINACKDIDIVLHIAWYAEPGEYINSPKNLTSMTGTLRLAELAARVGVARFVGIGTCFEYDMDLGYLRTCTPLRPHSVYGASKAGTFLVLSELLPRMDVSFSWCRLFYVYGEGEDKRRLVAYLNDRLATGKPAELTGGQQIRDFMDVTEVGRQIVEVSLSEIEGAVNICSGKPVIVRELAKKIAEEFGRPELLKFGARPNDPNDPPCVIGKPSLPPKTLPP